jgi:hypothetical protein
LKLVYGPCRFADDTVEVKLETFFLDRVLLVLDAVYFPLFIRKVFDIFAFLTAELGKLLSEFHLTLPILSILISKFLINHKVLSNFSEPFLAGR